MASYANSTPAHPEAAAGVSLPERYTRPWLELVTDRAKEMLRPGMTVLDVGSGRLPAIPPDARPESCEYVGLDLSGKILDEAPPGSYDETVIGDVADRVVALEDRFDLLVCRQVLEHVKPLDAALSNMRAYLKPGAPMIATLSGGRSLFGLLNRAIPSGLGVWMMRRLLGRPPETVFPAYYDRCTYDALAPLLDDWQSVSIEPIYRGAYYFKFSRALQLAYLRYENAVIARNSKNYATHYMIAATR
jgi:SAM-dependent methyltransferase